MIDVNAIDKKYQEREKRIMNKTELINVISETTSLSKKDAGAALDATIKAITDTLSKGEDVVLTGFGSFTVKERAAREGRNPATGEKMMIAASKSPAFKAGKSLKDAVK